jgi:hypothetical protein
MRATQLLAAAGVRSRKFAEWPTGNILLTAANQLIGSYAELRRFQTSRPVYLGWQAHHIVETQDLERLGVASRFPGRDDQICVLLPERAHIGRINSILRNQNPSSMKVTASDLRRAYGDAYSMMGDYCGGGEAAIRRELMAIVEAVFRDAGL